MTNFLQINKILLFYRKYFMSIPTSPGPRSASFQRLSRLLNGLTWACGLLALGLAAARWVLLGQGVTGPWRQLLLPVQALLGGVAAPPSLSWPWQLAGLALECLPLGALALSLASLHSICRAFIRGELFSAPVVRGFRRLGQGLVAMAVLSVLYGAGVTALLSWLASGRHGGAVTVAIGSFEISLLILGLMMFLLSQVMAEGQRLQAETEAFV